MKAPEGIWIRQWVEGGDLAVYVTTEDDAADGDPEYIRADLYEAKKDALERIIIEGNKPDTQATHDDGVGPNYLVMLEIAEAAL